MSFNERTKLAMGEENLEKITNSKIILFGVGGVGGYAAECLIRMGVGSITLVDFDTVAESNINRQIIALKSTIGKNKVDVFKQRAKEINKDCNINAINKKVTRENLAEFDLESFDIILDAIDSTNDKLALITYAKENGLNIISAMGAGNKTGLPSFQVMDIYKTAGDGLAKVMRKALREADVKNLSVVSSTEVSKKPDSENNKIGSVSYQVMNAGSVLAAATIQELIASK